MPCDIRGCKQATHVIWKPGKGPDEYQICSNHWQQWGNREIDLYKIFNLHRTGQAVFYFVNAPRTIRRKKYRTVNNDYARI
jgi:hypothetical protein